MLSWDRLLSEAIVRKSVALGDTCPVLPSPCAFIEVIFILYLLLFFFGYWWLVNTLCCLLSCLLLPLFNLHIFILFWLLFHLWLPLTARLVKVGVDENFSIAPLVHNPTAHPLSETSHMPQSVSGHIVYDPTKCIYETKQNILVIMYYYSPLLSAATRC